MGATVQQILAAKLPGYLRTHRVLDFVRRGAWALLQCRTAALGGHSASCPKGCETRVWYNSCRHRSCPRCSYRQIQAWLEERVQLLLPCDYFHVVFTLPHELLPLWRWNRRTLAALLFRVARDTLFTLLADARHLGATPGVLASLHTWSQTLALHPHVHLLVTGGGITPRGDWKPVRNGFLLPVRAVKVLFRGKFLGQLGRLLRQGRLALPPDLDRAGAQALLERAAAKKWAVRIKERYPHGRGVVTYLARYVRGGPLKNCRIEAFDGERVTFRYRDRRRRDQPETVQRLTLPAEQFLSRLLAHLPEPGQHVVRSYGLFHHTQRDAWRSCRDQLAAPAEPPLRSSATPLADTQSTPKSPEALLCRRCGQKLGPVEVIPRSGAPPPRLHLPEPT